MELICDDDFKGVSSKADLQKQLDFKTTPKEERSGLEGVWAGSPHSRVIVCYCWQWGPPHWTTACPEMLPGRGPMTLTPGYALSGLPGWGHVPTCLRGFILFWGFPVTLGKSPPVLVPVPSRALCYGFAEGFTECLLSCSVLSLASHSYLSPQELRHS